MPIGVYKRTEKHCTAIREGINRPEVKKRMCMNHKGMTGKHHSKETIRKIINGNKGKYVSEETKKKQRKSHLGKHLSEGAIEKVRIAAKKEMLEKWKNPEFKDKRIRAMFRGLHFRPTKPERRLRRGLDKLFPDDYKYVGDGKVWIGGKCPDFINVNGQKKIIELFGDYWHSKKVIGRTRKQEENQRIKHFAKYGYKTLIVWECELKNIHKLKRKLVKFCKDKTG